LKQVIFIIASRFVARDKGDSQWRSDDFEALVKSADKFDQCVFDDALIMATGFWAVSDAFFVLFIATLKVRLYQLAADFVNFSRRLPEVDRTRSSREEFDSILPAAESIFAEWTRRTQLPYLGPAVKANYIAPIQEVLSLAFTRYLDHRAFANTQLQPDDIANSATEAESMTPSEDSRSRPKSRQLRTEETSRRDRKLRAQAAKLKANGLSIRQAAAELAKIDIYSGMNVATIKRIIASAVR